MASQNSPEPSNANRTNPSILELGALCLDSEIIFGFTSHLLRRRGKVSERIPGREAPLPPELSPRKRLQSAEEDLRGSRPPPEGAGAGSLAEFGHSEGAGDGRGGWCRSCRVKVGELQKQALKLAFPSSLTDPQFSALIFDKLQVPDYLQKSRNEGGSRCEVCAAHVNQLKQEALRMIQALSQVNCQEMPDPQRSAAGASVMPRQTSQNMGMMSSQKDLPMIAGQVGRESGKPSNLCPGIERNKAVGWPQSTSNFPNSSVQVTVAPSGLSSALSSVTIQAQQYLQGMWSISRVNSFLPSPCLVETMTTEGGREGQTIHVTSGQNNSDQTGLDSSQSSQGLVAPAGVSAGTSASASFFIRAAQKLNLSSKRKKYHPPLLPSHEFSTYSTNFSGMLHMCPPPAPPCLLRAVSKVKDTPGIGKVKVMVRICPSQGRHNTSESMSFMKVDTRKKQVTLHDPTVNGHTNSGHWRPTVAPKMFAFDAVFPQDASQAEVCAGTVAEVIQSVVNGADGGIFCFGHVKLGKTYTMIGKDNSSQNLGIVPCAISWLFKLINERKEKTGTRFSIRVSAVEICGKDENLKDLLADEASSSLQDGQSPGVYLREDPICGTQLQNQSELRAPTAEKAAYFLDAAIAARSTSRPECDEEERRNSHMLFTLHIYQYRMEKSGKGGMSGGRSRLHLIDLGSCEKVLCKSRDGGGALCLSLTALGNVILALVNSAKHVPYKDSKLTMLLRESLGNINCRTTMIAHVSDSPANYAETLTTIQLASRIHRMRKKKSKYASSSSGGESSCEEGRVRRPPHLRPFHARTVAADPDLPGLGISSDPDYSSSSEQSCDTVIYVGPNGAALSDRELTDNEGPPEFVPIIPSLNKKRSKDNFSGVRSFDRDHFKCNTFAELQERLECMDGSEAPNVFAYEEMPVTSNYAPIPENVHSKLLKEKASPNGGYRKTASQEAVSSKTEHCLHSETTTQLGNGGTYEMSSSQSKMDHPQVQTKAAGGQWESISDGEIGAIVDSPSSSNPSASQTQEQRKTKPELVVKEKTCFVKRPLPSPAPPPPQPKDYSDVGSSHAIRTPPVGMSKKLGSKPEQSLVGSTFPLLSGAPHHSGAIEVHSFRSAVRGKCFDRDILTTTVTLQQPVELNGEDELVFTVVEELSIGGILDSGRPASIISFNSDCSLQALASGSRPVSIISSINDEFDAYTSQATAAGVNIDIVVPLPEDPFASSSRCSSISSWLSEVSICTMESDGARSDSGDHFILQSAYDCNKSEKPFDSDSSGVPVSQPQGLKSSLNDSGFGFSDVDCESLSSGNLSSHTNRYPPPFELTKVTPVKNASCATNPSTGAKSCSSQNNSVTETIHSSLPRKTKTTSSATHNNPMLNSKELQTQNYTFDDPWLVRTNNQLEAKAEDQLPLAKSSNSGTDNQLKQPGNYAQHFSSAPRPAQTQTMLACSQRVVDGCEVSSKSSAKKWEPSMKIPQLKRGATTLGVMPVTQSSPHADTVMKGNSDSTYTIGSLKTSTGKKVLPQKVSMLPRPGGTTPPAPPVRKSSLEQKSIVLPSSSVGKTEGLETARVTLLKSEDEADLISKPRACINEGTGNKINPKGEHSLPKTSSSLKTKASKTETVHRYGSHMSLDRCDSLTSVGSKASVSRDNGSSAIGNGRAGRSVPRLGVPPIATTTTSPPSYSAAGANKSSQARSATNQKVIANPSKNRSLSASGSKSLSSSVKSLNQSSGKSSNVAPNGKTNPRSVQCANSKPGRGTIMGTKQAIRAANSRVNELVSGNPGKMVYFKGSTDSDSGNDSGVNLRDEKSQIPVLPSPYSKITAPRRPQRYSSGHGSDNSSVLSGELPPAMGRTALFYHSGGSSGYESMIRDSEATGSASSAHDSMSESGMSSPGRMRSLKSPKKRAIGLQRRRLIPAPLPDTSTLGRKPSVTGQWVDLPPLPVTLKEPFEIKVYEIDDVERLQRHRQEETEPFQDVEKILERRQQQIREIKAKHEMLKEELEETKCRLMLDPNKWKDDFEVAPDLDKESEEYLEALEQVTEELEQCVNLCKSHIMMVTCFDIGMICDVQERVREVEV
uniref:Kinesin-like protein KIF26A isoform X2 n=1 Tax=Geotrypetes seraphini TaxID=260995 RepID=A0A6P8RRR6_GEOSA|nr:kinesin-like protein KIF26A isoform X2 [Geotrypetes seraphini]